MLLHIHIKNLAIVSDLEIDLRSGMTALTGETGAGKSILIDALGFTLGDRADSGMIKQGAERAEITAIFSLQLQPDIIQWLADHELESDDECHLRRLINRGGNSRAYINGTPVPLKLMQQLGEQLVDIHGQHAHHSLLRRDHQKHLLDDFANHLPLCQKVSSEFNQWQSAEHQLAELTAASTKRLERLDLIQFQVTELENLALGENELPELERDFKQQSNAEHILKSCGKILQHLDDDERGALHQLHQCNSELTDLNALEPSLRESLELLESATIQIQEACSSLTGFHNELELDPARLESLNQRLGEIHSLARKYRRKPEQLTQHLCDLKDELDQLQNTDIHLVKLQQEVADYKASYYIQAEKLSKKRLRASKKLSKQVTQSMQILGMPDGNFLVNLEQINADKANASGLDLVELRVSANPGVSPQSLTKVASGGELSRISLAIQVATISCRQVPTLIFDEVDVGIGGGVAEIVGQLLSRLGQSRQVLCVTHLPQVASQAHHHLLVRKSVSAKTTFPQLNHLSDAERVAEVARMLGGIKITEQTLAHAREMVEKSAATLD